MHGAPSSATISCASTRCRSSCACRTCRRVPPDTRVRVAIGRIDLLDVTLECRYAGRRRLHAAPREPSGMLPRGRLRPDRWPVRERYDDGMSALQCRDATTPLASPCHVASPSRIVRGPDATANRPPPCSRRARGRPAATGSVAPRAAPQRRRRKAHLAFAGALPPARIPPESLAPAAARIVDRRSRSAFRSRCTRVAMTIHFTFGSGRITDNAPPLQVALVNAKSASKPAKADILAQANLDGGGNTEKDRRAKTPLPVLPRETPRQNVAVASPRAEVQENTTREMLTQLKSAVVDPDAASRSRSRKPERTESPTANEMMQRTLEAMRLEAQIARDMDAYQKIPRRKLIGAQAKEYRFARYVEDWRMKVERVGNLNYPEAARQNKLYGSLILTVFIRADGSVENVEINRKSGQRILDAAAVKIVEMAGPYSPFPDDIRRDTDILTSRARGRSRRATSCTVSRATFACARERASRRRVTACSNREKRMAGSGARARLRRARRPAAASVFRRDDRLVARSSAAARRRSWPSGCTSCARRHPKAQLHYQFVPYRAHRRVR